MADFRSSHRADLGKMAEVSGKLPSGVYRMCALRNNRNRVVCAARGPGCASVTCTCGVREESDQDLLDAQPESRSKSADVCAVTTRKSKQKDETFAPASPRFVGVFERVQSHHTALYINGRLQETLLTRGMTFWTRDALSFSPDTFRSPQQLRAFCTIILLLADQGSERPRCRENIKYHNSPASGRNYSRSTDSPLYRSRTAYYDILKVSPGATQSQIKSAYYKQCFIYHPDKNPGGEEATRCFSEIAEAYSILGNIGLRKKYDRGILSSSDVQSVGRHPSKEATSRPTGPSQHQQRARSSSGPAGKIMFDFDAFYQAHYGAQLQKERAMKAKREQMRVAAKKKLEKWKERKMVQVAVSMLLAVAGVIFVSLTRT